MKRVNNKCMLILGVVIGIIISVTSVYAVDAYIESRKVSYDNKYTNKSNTQEAIDELYERSGIHKEEWQDPTLEESGNYPVIKNGLIPVEIKPNGDTYYASTKSEWYNYGEKRWANAVILNDDAVSKYTVGMKIKDADIKGYFVWIPRYSYKIWNTGEYTKTLSLGDLKNSQDDATSEGALWKITGNNTRIIDIKFVSTETKEEGSTVGSYLTHPAFTLGDKTLSGIWVGKFETGGSTESLIVKPNVVSLRNQTVKEFFDAGKSFAQNLDSHMMKNTEWGAVAYLSHSEYGIGNEVNINNASDFYTGYSAAPGTNQSTMPSDSAEHNDGTKTQPWNTPVGYLASTTGNISGIYDMSGGAWEYMAACMDGIPLNSGFDTQTLASEMEKGYIDKYNASSEITTYNYRILGDATGEMGPFYNYYENNGTAYNHSSWYGDYANFVGSTYPWFHRGSHSIDGVLAGQFHFNRATGGANGAGGFRVVLSPQ